MWLRSIKPLLHSKPVILRHDRGISLQAPAGFTLVELVIGIVVFSIVITIVTTLVTPQAIRSVDPIFQVRATELAQGLLNEISAKAYDENTDPSGGVIRCNENLDGDTGTDFAGPGEVPCSAVLGPDAGETRDTFNDVDDYNGLLASGATLANSIGETLTLDGEPLYANFSAAVVVSYAGGDLGLAAQRAKRIQVTITAPNEQNFVFSRYRTNF